MMNAPPAPLPGFRNPRGASLLAAFVCIWIALSGCAEEASQEPGPPPAQSGIPRPTPTGMTPETGTELLLVGMDGMTWHVVDSLLVKGQLPQFQRLIQRGVRGALRSERPLQSPPIWTTIATGKSREEHGIKTFFRVQSDGRKIPVTSQMRTARAFWNIFSDTGISVGVVGWWPTWPAERVERGFIISDRAWPVNFSPNAVPYGTRRDQGGQVQSWDFARRTWPEELFEEFRPFILTEESVITPEITTQIFGKRVQPTQEMWNAYWVYAKDMTFVRAGLHFLEAQHPRVFALYLEGPDVMSHYYWHYRRVERFEIEPEKSEIFGQAVDRYYRYCDEVVRRLLAAAGAGASVIIVSDHGFETLWDLKERWERGEVIEHEGGRGGYPYTHGMDGVFIASGPGFASGVNLENASIYDVMPTLLHRVGLPAGEDMPGRVLEEAFTEEFLERIPPRRIQTWERGDRSQAEEEPLVEGPMDDAILEKLRTLGYVD